MDRCVIGISGKAGILVKRGSGGTIVDQVILGSDPGLFALVLNLCDCALCCRNCGAVRLFAKGVGSRVLIL